VTDDDQFEKDEKQILELLSKGLAKDFHNPSRLGCPDSAVIEGIASHRIGLAQAEQWLDHLGSCSACFAEFRLLRKRLQNRRQIALGSTLAILLAASAVWFPLHSRLALVTDETIVLDLRGSSIERGPQPQAKQPQLEISRRTKHLILYLPMGTEERDYELALLKDTGDELAHTTGIAQFEKHVVILKADIDFSNVPGNSYFLGLRVPGLEWARFPVRVH